MLYFENLDEIITIYEKTIQYSGGGAKGILRLEQLKSILEFIKDDNYYPNIEDKLTHLFWSINKNHIFQDGNKRMALTLSAMFLLKNGYVAFSRRFISEMEIFTYHVAAGRIDKELLKKIISSFLYEDDYSEELKLEILKAINE